MLRLNTAIAPGRTRSRTGSASSATSSAGGSDNAGYPNGRRPKDDVVDISLIAVMGGLCVANGDADTLKLRRRVQAVRRAARHGGFSLNDTVDQAGRR